MQAVTAAIAIAMALLWVPAASRLLATWTEDRKPIYLGFLGAVLWFVYHNTLHAVSTFDVAGTGVLVEQSVELLVLFNVYISLRKSQKKREVKTTNGVNHD